MEEQLWTAIVAVIVSMCGTVVVMLKASANRPALEKKVDLLQDDLNQIKCKLDDLNQIKCKLDDLDAEDEDGVPVRFSAVKVKKAALHCEKMLRLLLKEMGVASE